MTETEQYMTVVTSEFEAILAGKKKTMEIAGTAVKDGDVVHVLECDDQGEFTDRSLTRKIRVMGTGIPFGMTFRVTIVELME